MILALAVALLCVLTAWPYAASPVSFDGAMNLQVAQALAASQGYARFYEDWSLFPEEVQTNAPYVLPAALLFSVSDVSFVTSQLVSLIYLASFLWVVFWLIRPVTGSAWALLAVLLTLTVVDFGRFALNGYGEVPALFWCLLGLGLGLRGIDGVRSGRMLWAGVCFALSVLTKIVMLMPVGLCLLVLGGACLQDNFRRGMARLIQGVVGTMLLFELWRLWTFGSLGAWKGWWTDLLTAVLAQAGVADGFSDTPGLLAKLAVHSAAFSNAVQLEAPWLYGLLLMPVLGLLLVRQAQLGGRSERRTVLLLSSLLLVCVAYFCWWLLVTPTQKAWYRRIFNGWLVFAVLVPLLMGYAHRLGGAPYRRLTMAALAIPLVLMVWSSVQSLSFRKNEIRTAGVASAVDFINGLPGSRRFYGYAWYSAPVIALYADIRVYDLAVDKTRIGDPDVDHYLLVDAPLRASGDLERALDGLDAELVHDGGPWASIYRLSSRTKPPFHR